jgi:3-ketosteroid 9alpha-monooxygenase subunit B
VLSSPGVPAVFHELEVSNVREDAADTRSFSFALPPALRERFRYRAGQYVTLEVPCAGRLLRRCYSLSSAPERAGDPTVTVKRVPGGRVSNHLLDGLGVGHRLRVSEPEGHFVLSSERRAELTLLAAGSGITPMLSLVVSALCTTERPVTLLYASRTRALAPFVAQLHGLVEQYAGRLHLHLHYDDEQGLVTSEQLTTLLPGTRGDFYVCGPAGFMDLVEAHLEARAVPAARMHFERFVSPRDPDRLETSAAPGYTPRHFRLRLLGKTHHVPYDGTGSLLAAARAHGVLAPSSCEDGYCGTCMAQRRTGEVHMARSEALSARDLARGRVLLCQARAVGEQELSLDCDAVAFRISDTRGDRVPQPLMPRLLASLFVGLVFAAYFLLRAP